MIRKKPLRELVAVNFRRRGGLAVFTVHTARDRLAVRAHGILQRQPHARAVADRQRKRHVPLRAGDKAHARRGKQRIFPRAALACPQQDAPLPFGAQGGVVKRRRDELRVFRIFAGERKRIAQLVAAKLLAVDRQCRARVGLAGLHSRLRPVLIPCKLQPKLIRLLDVGERKIIRRVLPVGGLRTHGQVIRLPVRAVCRVHLQASVLQELATLAAVGPVFTRDKARVLRVQPLKGEGIREHAVRQRFAREVRVGAAVCSAAQIVACLARAPAQAQVKIQLIVDDELERKRHRLRILVRAL